jgi:hypothetical protein
MIPIKRQLSYGTAIEFCHPLVCRKCGKTIKTKTKRSERHQHGVCNRCK